MPLFKKGPAMNAALAGALAGGILSWVVLVSPKQAQLAEFQNKTAAVEKKLAAARAKSPAIAEWEKKLSAEEELFKGVREKMAAVESASLSESQWLAILEGRLLGKKVGSLRHETMTELSREEIWPFVRSRTRVTVSGTFEDLMSYYQALESAYPKEVRVLSSKLNRKDKGAVFGETLDLEIMATYRLGKASQDKTLSVPKPLHWGQTPFTWSQESRGSGNFADHSVSLSGIYFRGKNAFAVLNGQPKKTGDVFLDGILVKSITPQGVTLSRNGFETLIRV